MFRAAVSLALAGALVAAPLAAQRRVPDLAALVERTEAGDAAARDALTPHALGRISDAAQRRLPPAESRDVARMALALAAPLTAPEAPPTGREQRWRGAAVRALRSALAQDSADVWSAERLFALAPYPYLWLEAPRELAHVRALAARFATLPASVIEALVGLELEVGTLDRAKAALAHPAFAALPAATRGHLAAQVAFATGDARGGHAAYTGGARAIATPDDVVRYRQDLAWFADSTDLRAFTLLPFTGARHAAWLEAFWSRQDFADARTPGTRLAEQFVRWRHALRRYRWDEEGSAAQGLPVPRSEPVPGVAGDGWSDAMPPLVWAARLAPESRLLDDRGRLTMRHGVPAIEVRPYGGRANDGATLGWHIPDGLLTVGFARVAFGGGPLHRYGMLARNTPYGDWMQLCGIDARYCALAGRPAGDMSAFVGQSRLLERYRAMRDAAERTSGNAERFGRDLGAVIQVYGIAGTGVLAVVAVPVDSVIRIADREGAWPARVRVLVGDPGTGRIVASLDTVGTWRRDAVAGGGTWLATHLTVPVPPGEWSVAVVVSDTAAGAGSGQRTAAVPVVEAVPTATTLTLADPVLGRAGSELRWHTPLVDLPLNAVNAWRSGDRAPFYYEVGGLVPGRRYETELALRSAEAPRGRNSRTTTFGTVARTDHEVVQHALSLEAVTPGDYTLVVRIRDTSTGEEVTRSRRVAVR